MTHNDLAGVACLLVGKRLEVLVCADDIEHIANGMWTAQAKLSGYRYVVGCLRGGKRMVLARHIVNAPHGVVVDHINGNGLDNRRANLRICTQAQNLKNKGRNASKVFPEKCIYPHRTKSGEGYRVIVAVARKATHIGVFATLDEARAARDAKLVDLHGPFARFA